MSLKAFHIIFITASSLLCFGFGGWALNQYLSHGGGGNLAYGIVSLAAGVGLIVYGMYFLKKLKHISFL